MHSRGQGQRKSGNGGRGEPGPLHISGNHRRIRFGSDPRIRENRIICCRTKETGAAPELGKITTPPSPPRIPSW